MAVAAPLSGLALGYAVARSIHLSITQLSVRIRDAAGRLSSEVPPVVLEDPSDLPDLHRQMQGVVEEIERVVERLQQREREVLRAEQLAAVGQVAAGVAHELRNPLTSVKMLVQTGLEGPQPVGLALDDLAIIEHEVRRMEACIQTFLDFARPPNSEKRCTDLLAVVRRAAGAGRGPRPAAKGAMRRRLAGRPRRVGNRRRPDSPSPGQPAAERPRRATPGRDDPPGSATAGCSAFPRRGGPAEPGAAVVEVRDDGPGIAPKIQERLFEPFISTKETGLGLGLSICRRLVEANGGAIHGGNASEGGAVFAFTLPVGEEESPQRHKGHKEE